MLTTISAIQPADDPFLASIIRAVLLEFGANRPGTVYYDDATDHLSEVFTNPQSAYFTVRLQDEIVGGAGIFPSKGLPKDTCELVKMYLLPEARGKGIGHTLIQTCIETAKRFGFTSCYLETLPELQAAQYIYQKHGFDYLTGPMGDTGHFGCDIWMLKDL